MITRWLIRFVDRRLRIAAATNKAVAKIFPDHWSFMLGEIALYAFLLLVATGVFLSLFFEPSAAETVYIGSYAPLHGSTVSAAYASSVELSWDVRGGLLFRQAHHWAALIFVAAIVAHLCRVFFTGAFRKPRELNWIVGVTMLLLALLNGFAGYSLPDDLLSGTGLRIASAIMLSVPFVGPWAQMIAFDGEFPGDSIIERLYIGHVFLVPGALALLIAVHLAIIVRQKHTHFAGRGRSDHNVVGSSMWPTYAFRSLALLCAVVAVIFGLGGVAQINPVWLWGPFYPTTVTSPAQPDWYVGWLEGALRLFPPVEMTVAGYLIPAPFVPGVVLPALTFLVLYAWPWIDRLLMGDKHAHHVLEAPRIHPGRTAIGVWALAFYGLLLVAGGDDVLARTVGLPILDVMRALRVLVLTVPFALAALAFVLAKALRDSEATGLLDLRWRDIRATHLKGRTRRRPTSGALPSDLAPVDAEGLAHRPVVGHGDAPEPVSAEKRDPS